MVETGISFAGRLIPNRTSRREHQRLDPDWLKPLRTSLDRRSEQSGQPVE